VHCGELAGGNGGHGFPFGWSIILATVADKFMALVAVYSRITGRFRCIRHVREQRVRTALVKP
jgi:hypothetical protein